jgi:hypothetical protein
MAMRLSDFDTLPTANAGMLIGMIRGVITASSVVLSHGHASTRTALTRVRTRGETLRLAHHATPVVKPLNMAKPTDLAVDRIVGIVESRLADYDVLSGPRAVEAARIHPLLFPEGLGFLRFKYKEEWVEVDALLTRIEENHLQASLDDLVGPEFIEHLRGCQAAYGDALHLTRASEATSTPATLAEPFAAARDALATYVNLLVVLVRNEELPEADVRRALNTIAEVRDTLSDAKKRAAKEEEVAEDEEQLNEELPNVV